MRTPLKTPEALIDAGLVAPERKPGLDRVAASYAIAVTPHLANLIDPDAADDPIGLQFLPDVRELDILPSESADPIGDAAHSPVEGLVHRYPDRVLLKVTHACAVYCRFCFRREMVGPGKAPGLAGHGLEAALAYIEAHPEIWEVILTGGDPLVLSARRLRQISERLRDIPHVKVLRLHTRLPVAAPERITPAVISALKASKKAVYVAVHANHAREFTEEARAACARLADAGLPLLGQTVLLKGVNDRPEVLGALFRAMVETRIRPYYLHHPDLAPGTAHFRPSLAQGQALMRALRGDFSGLCQPTYVLDIPGGAGKAPVGPNHLSAAEETVMVEDPWGGLHPYPPPED